MSKSYYIVIPEWNYPTSKGAGVPFESTFPDKESALEAAKKGCEMELGDFAKETNEDPLKPEWFKLDDGSEGYLITSKMGLDDWFYALRVVEVKYLYI